MEAVWSSYNTFMENGDPRTKFKPFMTSPVLAIAILILYFLFVYNARTIMANRKPLQLKTFSMVYNCIMVIFSAYMTKEFAMSGWLTGYSLGCQPVDTSPAGDRMAWAAYVFFLSKYVELTDTVILVLRKKFNQLSFLHVFHHGFLPFNWWFGVRYAPGGWGTFHAFINANVHTIMYLYYGLSALGPSVQKYLWWKKYITTIQIVQFVGVICHTSYAFFFVEDCSYPMIFVKAVFMYNVIFLYLFVKFYIQTYNKSKKSKENGSISNGHTMNGQTRKVE